MQGLPPGFPAMSIAEAHARLTAPGQMFELGEADTPAGRVRFFTQAPPSLRQVFDFLQLFGARECLVFEGERCTYAAHRKAVLRFAEVLAEAGIGKGDRVVLALRNVPEWTVGFWACAVLGAISVPLNAWWTGTEMEYACRDSGAKAALLDGERLQRLAPHLGACPDLKTLFVCRSGDGAVAPAQRFEDLVGTVAAWSGLPDVAAPAHAIEADDDLTIFYSSGTTGTPKGVVLSHRNVISNIFNMLAAQARSFLRRGEAPPAPNMSGPQQATLLSIPLFHVTGCFGFMLPTQLVGGRLVLTRKFEPEQAMALIQKERVTRIGGVPAIAWQILEHPRLQEYDLSSVELITYGGAPSSPELVRRLKQGITQANPAQAWGMTETAAIAVSNFAEDYVLRPWSCGVPAPGAEAKIVGADGAVLPPGEVGELWYKGPVVSRGYWGKPDATRETFQDGWVKTGDLARMDDEGFIAIVDRLKDMVIRGGENIYSVEVENVLYEHPAVMDAAVVGRAHPILGEEPVAIVHLAPGQQATAEELRAFVGQRLAAFKVPVEVFFRPENLPRNPQGKILKRELKALIAGG